MTDRPQRDDEAALLLKAHYADTMLAWNKLEKLAHLIVYKLAGGIERIEALTASLQASSLSLAMNSLSTAFDEPARSHVKNFADRFDRLREWRNHYVHGPIAVGFNDEGIPGAIVQTVKVKKGGLAGRNDFITAVDLHNMMNQILDLQRYGSAITVHLWDVPVEPAPLEEITIPPLAPELPPGRLAPFLRLDEG